MRDIDNMDDCPFNFVEDLSLLTAHLLRICETFHKIFQETLEFLRKLPKPVRDSTQHTFLTKMVVMADMLVSITLKSHLFQFVKINGTIYVIF